MQLLLVLVAFTRVGSKQELRAHTRTCTAALLAATANGAGPPAALRLTWRDGAHNLAVPKAAQREEVGNDAAVTRHHVEVCGVQARWLQDASAQVLAERQA